MAQHSWKLIKCGFYVTFTYIPALCMYHLELSAVAQTTMRAVMCENVCGQL